MENEISHLCLSRRRLLGVIFGAGVGLLAGASKADAMWSVSDLLSSLAEGGVPKPDPNVPPALRGILGAQTDAYSRFLARLNLRSMSVRQIIDAHAKAHGRVHNTLPPRQYWPNIRNTLRVVDRVANRLGQPVHEVVSVYRNPAYNATCPGAKSNSYHMRNNAIDLRFKATPAQVARAARELRQGGLFQGGVGRYANFTHIDTRGFNADW